MSLKKGYSLSLFWYLIVKFGVLVHFTRLTANVRFKLTVFRIINEQNFPE